MSDIGSLLNSTLNGSAGSAQTKSGTTIQTFALSLASGFVLFAVQFTIFLAVRNYLWAKRIYQPRSFLVPVKQRVQPPHSNPFKWLIGVFKIKEDPEVLQKDGMDAYFFLRYLSMCLKIFTPMAVIILPILIPLNTVGGKGKSVIGDTAYNVTGLDTLAWSNVSPRNTNRYWAHLILAIVVIAWVCFIFHEELIHYIRKRQEYLGSAAHRLKASSTTVLITDIPVKLCNEDALMEMYGDFPGGVRRIWINRDFTALEKRDEYRKQVEDTLENAETDMIRKAIKLHGKRMRKNNQPETKPLTPESEQTAIASNTVQLDTEPPTAAICQRDLQYDLSSKATWTEYLTPKQRATMRIPNPKHGVLSKIPLLKLFFSTKVDTIYWCRRELARANKELEFDIEDPTSYPINRTAFIQFNSQKAAHIACQSVAGLEPRHMRQRVVEISPADINWKNLNLGWRQQYIRVIGFLALYFVLLFVFGIVSVFTGILSRVSTLAYSTSWLRWVGSLPSWLISFIQGTLPTFIQVVVLSGPLPILIRYMTNSGRGAMTGSAGERSLQLWYLIFLVIELFLIPTISSGLTSIVNELIHSPTSVPNILATNLPTAGNYFFSFLILQALSLSATSLLQTIRLFNFYVLGSVNSPDSVYEKLSWTNRTRIGSNIPWYTTFAVIGLVYSIIAPLILVFELITFGLFWTVIKNNLLYCVRTGDVDSGGLWFPSAINQTFVGIYFMEIALVGLFFLVRNTNNDVACDAQGIIMAIVLVLTVIYHIWLMMHLNKLFNYAPVRLESESTNLLKNDDEESEKDEPKPGHSAVISSDVGISDDISERPSAMGESNDEKEKGDEESEQLSELRGPSAHPRNSSHSRTRKASKMDMAHQSSGEIREDPDSEPLPSPKRPTFRNRDSSLSMRSGHEMQAKQREDVKAARQVLARINRPLDEARLQQLESMVERVEEAAGNYLLPRRKDIETQMMNDPISRIIMQHNDELETLEPEERDMLISIAFTHPVLRAPRPAVWIPRDDLGISDDEVKRMKTLSEYLDVDNKGAYFNQKLKVEVDKPPPDMSEFALVMGML